MTFVKALFGIFDRTDGAVNQLYVWYSLFGKD
jgi:hypothetical protein